MLTVPIPEICTTLLGNFLPRLVFIILTVYHPVLAPHLRHDDSLPRMLSETTTRDLMLAMFLFPILLAEPVRADTPKMMNITTVKSTRSIHLRPNQDEVRHRVRDVEMHKACCRNAIRCPMGMSGREHEQKTKTDLSCDSGEGGMVSMYRLHSLRQWEVYQLRREWYVRNHHD